MAARPVLAASVLLAALGATAALGQSAPEPSPPPRVTSVGPAPSPAAPVAPAPVPVQARPAPPAPAADGEAAARSAEPMKRVRRNAAVIQALDKATAETLRFEALVNQPVRYKDLIFTVHACEDAAPDEVGQGSFAHVQIDSQPRAAPGRARPAPRQVFRGWISSQSPTLNPLEHPVYDAWLITCRTARPSA